MAQKPRHDDDGTICPMLKEPCANVCHTCKMWRSFPVRDQQGNKFDHWDCTLSLGTPLQAETTGMVAANVKATQQYGSLALETAKIAIAADHAGDAEAIAAATQAFKLLEVKELVRTRLAAPEAP